MVFSSSRRRTNSDRCPAFPAGLPPTVLVDRAFGHPHFDTVGSDNFDAGYRGCRHLLELGHRDVTLLISSTNHTHLRDRLDGYRRALGEAGLARASAIVFGGGTAEGCRSAIEQDLRRPDPPTAIFAATFYATMGAVKAISALELSFPEEISLLGFEHSDWMTAVRPYISSVEQSVDELASRSWQTLHERIKGEPTELARVLLDFRFGFRESTRPPQGNCQGTPRRGGSDGLTAFVSGAGKQWRRYFNVAASSEVAAMRMPQGLGTWFRLVSAKLAAVLTYVRSHYLLVDAMPHETIRRSFKDKETDQ